jgi:hypothetical protein
MSMNTKAVPSTQSFELEEGMQIELPPGAYPPRDLFIFTAWASTVLGGKLVHCAGILPGVSLLVHVFRPYDLDDITNQISSLWSHVQSPIEDWIEVGESFPCLTIAVDDARVILALDRVITLEKGVVQINASAT